jgi:hypothetical protein
MDLSRTLRVAMGIGDGLVSVDGLALCPGGGTQWVTESDVVYQRLGGGIERANADGSNVRVLDAAGANTLVAGGGVAAWWHAQTGYHDTHNRHEVNWFPLAVDDATGTIAALADSPRGAWLVLWDGRNSQTVVSGVLDSREACYRNGGLGYMAHGRFICRGVPYDTFGCPGVQFDQEFRLAWSERHHALVLHRLGTSQAAIISRTGKDFNARLRVAPSGLVTVVSSGGQGEAPHELVTYVFDPKGAEWVDLAAMRAPVPTPEPEPTAVTITTFAPTEGPSPLSVRAVATFTAGTAATLRWRFCRDGADLWTTAATRPVSDLVYTFVFSEPGGYEIGVDALDASGGILNGTSSRRHVRVTARASVKTLASGDRLERGDVLMSDRHLLTLQESDGRLVLYRTRGMVPLWSAPASGIDTVVMQADGNLVGYTGNSWVWNTSTQGHPGAFATLQDSDGNFVVYGSDLSPLWASNVSDATMPHPPTSAKPPNLRIVGKDWRDGDSLYAPRWVSELSILTHTEQEKRRYIEWMRDTRFNGGRVFAGRLAWANQSASDARKALPELIDLHRVAGLALEVTAVTDSGSGYDWRSHLFMTASLCLPHEHVVLEGANELGHSTQASSVTSESLAEALRPYSRPWAVGAPLAQDEPSPDGSWPAGQGGYSTVHLDRGRDPWNMARRVREIYAVVEATGKPALNNEPLGAGPNNEPGRRSNDPAIFAVFGALDGGFRGVGGVHHGQSGLMATVPDKAEQRCADAYVQAHLAVRAALGNDAGVYKNVGHDGSPMASADFTRVTRIYSFIAGNRGVSVYVGAVVSGRGEVWQHGWQPVDTRYILPGQDGRVCEVVEIRR